MRVLEAASVGLIVLTRTGRVQSANPAAQRITGLTRGQLVKQQLDHVAIDHGGGLATWLADPHGACVVDLEFSGLAGQARVTGWMTPLSPSTADEDHAVLQIVPVDLTVDRARLARQFDAVSDDLSDAVVITNADLTVTDLNARAGALFDGLAEGDSLSTVLSDRHEELVAAMRTADQDSIRVELAIGGSRAEAVLREIRDSIGGLVGHALVVRSGATDSASPERAQSGKGVTDSGALAVLASSTEVSWVFDETGPVLASAGARALLDLGPDHDVAHIALADLVDLDSAQRLIDALGQLDAGQTWRGDLTLLDAAGGAHECEAVLNHHVGPPATWTLTAPAVTPTAEPKLRDEATGLPTEAVLLDRLGHSIDRSLRNGRRTCLVIFEIDGYEQLVPAIGESMAQLLGNAVAERLRLHVRPGDTLARTAESVFEVVRDDVADLQDAERFAERLRVSLDEPVTVDGVRWYVTLNAGVALTQPGVTAAGGLRRNARLAGQQAIEQGGACTVVFGRALQARRDPREANDSPRAARSGSRTHLRYGGMLRSPEPGAKSLKPRSTSTSGRSDENGEPPAPLSQ